MEPEHKKSKEQTVNLDDDYTQACQTLTLDIGLMRSAGASDDELRGLVSPRLKNIAKRMWFLGREVIVEVPFYLMLGDDDYRIHAGDGLVTGVATGLRYDPEVSPLTPDSSLELQLIVEDKYQIRRLVPLSVPHEVVAL
ncbi:hypothetical protein HY441_00735 [Candidatus Microgenomates bacterium]|nr:hypothetical protein [Candidatus Microgenomates bacterium]